MSRLFFLLFVPTFLFIAPDAMALRAVIASRRTYFEDLGCAFATVSPAAESRLVSKGKIVHETPWGVKITALAGPSYVWVGYEGSDFERVRQRLSFAGAAVHQLILYQGHVVKSRGGRQEIVHNLILVVRAQNRIHLYLLATAASSLEDEPTQPWRLRPVSHTLRQIGEFAIPGLIDIAVAEIPPFSTYVTEAVSGASSNVWLFALTQAETIKGEAEKATSSLQFLA